MQPSKAASGGSSHPTTQPSSDDADLTSPANLRKLVLNYLLHHCYTDTAIAFAKDGIIGDLYNGDAASAFPIASSSNAGSASTSALGTASASSSRASASAASTTDAALRSSTNGGGRQAHPLSAPPLSRDDSSMEIEVENLLPTSSEHAGPASHDHTNGYSNGAILHSNGRSSQTRPSAVHDDDEDLEDAELTSEVDQVEDEDLDSDISPDLTADELRAVRARKQIKDFIISGHIRQAMDMCNEYFPTVLNSTALNASKSSRTKSSSTNPCEKVLPANPTSMDPDHLLLNLQIQVFIEAIRSASSSQLAPPASTTATPQLGPSGGLPSLASTTPGIASSISRAASPAPSTSSSNGSNTSATNAALNPALNSALAYAQSLYASAQKLPSYWRSMYFKELEQVTALLAYTDVEHSPVRRFLHRSRKVALAEQVNSAILLRSGKPSQPLIEVAVRQTTLLWKHLQAEEVQVPIGHPVFGLVGNGAGYEEAVAGGGGGGKKHAHTKKVPAWQFRTFLQER